MNHDWERMKLRMCCQVSSIQAALAVFGVSQANLRRGKVSTDPDVKILRALETPKFAPNGCDFAVMVAVEPYDCLDKLKERQIFPPGHDPDFCSIVVVKEGMHSCVWLQPAVPNAKLSSTLSSCVMNVQFETFARAATQVAGK